MGYNERQYGEYAVNNKLNSSVQSSELAGVGMEDLDQVLVAGQFGAHLPVESLVGAGILPREVEEKVVYVGNASKNGAYMTLLSRRAREEVEALAEKMEYLELAQTDGYERIFAECMIFPEY